MAKQGKFRGAYKQKKHIVSIELGLYFWEDEKVHFVYSPALDLTGYGNSEDEAEKSFELTLEETFKYMENKGTMYDELERLGWTVNRKKKRVKAPAIEELEEDNKDFAKLASRSDVSVKQQPIELALA